ncbi:hypothetical protein QE152_g1121 [Popillia japonica]|uniref:DUF8207 domain-containing protein n=1 Tax=Popillia japonica TaxID=7064 RepID=A0AAW1N612_POPJA
MKFIKREAPGTPTKQQLLGASGEQDDAYQNSPLSDYFQASHELPRRYIRSVKTSPDNDNTFGPIYDKVNNRYTLGKETIDFVGADIIINSKKFKGTEGLYELIFKTQPTNYNAEDEAEYRKILLETQVHRRNFDEGAHLRSSKSSKYLKIIKPLVSGEISGKGHMIVSDKPFQYVYWDNINELVHRLRLLIASQNAGNTSHNNEIMSIIEELREAGVVE